MVVVQKTSIRRGDRVAVISGKEKGKIGKVLSVSFKTGRVCVEGLNLVKRHIRGSAQQPQGGVISQELGLHPSNVQLFCERCARGVRFSVMEISVSAGIKKVRVCKRCDQHFDAT